MEYNNCEQRVLAELANAEHALDSIYEVLKDPRFDQPAKIKQITELINLYKGV